MSRGLALTTGVLAGLFGLSCDSSSCTDANCEDVLEVIVSGIDEFSAVLEVEGKDPVERVCPSSCATFGEDKVLLFYGAPQDAVIVIRDVGGREVAQEAIHPEYVDITPNGPTCPPGCRKGSVTVSISVS